MQSAIIRDFSEIRSCDHDHFEIMPALRSCNRNHFDFLGDGDLLLSQDGHRMARLALV
jgi:hypothetical protein